MRRAAAVLLPLAVLGVVGALSPDVRGLAGEALDGDAGGLRRRLDGLGGWAVLVLVAGALVHVVVPIPAELLTAAAGYALGVALGLPVIWAAWVASAVLTYVVSEAAGRPLARRLAGEERLARLEQLLERGGARALLAMRLLPLLPFNAVCAAAGVARVPLWRFTWTTAVGILPLTALVVVLGARLQEPRLGDPLLWGTLLGCLLAVLAGPPAARRLGAR